MRPTHSVMEIAKAAPFISSLNVLAMDGIDKVGLAYGGERFVINVTSPGRPRPLTIFSRLTYTHWGVVRADAPRRIPTGAAIGRAKMRGAVSSAG